MNNRIMAMLFALVAAMFISIVPVKAEAAVENHNHAGTWIDAVPATCAKDGMQKYFKCNTCDYKANTANQQVTSDQLVISKSTVAHTYEWDHSDTQHFKKCTVCGTVSDSSKVLHQKDCSPNNNGGHTWTCKDPNCDWTVTEGHDLDANCKCQYCDEVKHQLELVEAKASTCVAKGNKAYYKCTNNGCNAKFLADTMEQVTSDKLELDYADHTATWVFDEKEHYQKCTTEGCRGSWNKADHDKLCTDNKDGTHTWTCKTEGCKWTKTEDHVDGETDGNCVCNHCDAELDHKLGPWQQSLTHHQRVCTKTNCKEVVDAGEHVWGDAQAVEGKTYHVKVCQTCGFERQFDCTSTKDKDCLCDECGTLVKHVDTDLKWVPGVDATCEKDGNRGHYACKTCGKIFKDVNGKFVLDTEKVVRDKLGHKFGGEGYGWRETDDGTAHFKMCINGCGTHVYSTAEGVVVGDEAHTHGSWYDNKAGYHCEICAVCGLSYGDEKHDYSIITRTEVLSGANKKQQHVKTCECGAVTYEECTFDKNCVCTVCGTDKTHEWKVLKGLDGVAATCTTTGKKAAGECRTCGKIYLNEGGKLVLTTQQGRVIPALGHKWVPSLTMDDVDGKHVMTCSNEYVVNGQTVKCTKATVMNHYTEDDDCICDVPGCNVVAHSHTYIQVPGKAATCTEDGVEAYNKYAGCGRMFDLDQNEIDAPVVIPATGHTPADNWVPGEEGKHVQLCEDCGEAVYEAEHDFSNGSVCPDCNANESLTRVPAVAATCYNTGNIEHWVAVNGDKYADKDGITKLAAGAEVTAKLEHNLVWQPMADGQRHQEVCTNTGCTRQPVIENHSDANSCYCAVCDSVKGGHNLKTHAMEASTCAKVGHEAYYECEGCHKLYDMGYNPITAPKALSSVKHVMDTKVYKDTAMNQHYIKCKNCSYKLYEEHVMILDDPMSGNYHQWLCECGELEIETHNDTNGDGKCDVCDHDMSGKKVEVQQHNNTTVYTGQSDKMDSTKNWLWNWSNWFTPSNSGGSSVSAEKPAEDTTTGNTGNTGSTGSNGSTGSTGNTGSSSSSSSSSSEKVPANNTPAVNQPSVITQLINLILSWLGF